jgi:hypothetical protein
MAWRLEDTKFRRVVKIRPNLHAYIFTGKDRTVAVLSDGPGEVESGKQGRHRMGGLVRQPAETRFQILGDAGLRRGLYERG